MPESADYSVRRFRMGSCEVVQLFDSPAGVQVGLVPAVGNMAYEMKVKGKDVLWFPFATPGDLRAQPAMCGIPFLAPWANRLDGPEYWANGRKYGINSGLGNIRCDPQGRPIHGLLRYSGLWEVVSTGADANSAWATSRLDFWKYPDLMAQFPFAHSTRITYRLSRGELEVETEIDNLAAEPMPVAVGFHPYLRLDDAPRDEWTIHIAARDRLRLDDRLIPTGERAPVPFADAQPLAGLDLDHVFAGLVQDADGKARFHVQGRRQRVTVTYGPRYRIAVAYAPPGRDFICFEPMAAVTNAFNLAHAGTFPELDSIPPGGTWKESFWIAATGFDDL